MKTLKFLCIWSLALLAMSVFAKAQNLKPEEIIAKHLESIGSKSALAEVKTLMAIGQSEFLSTVPAVKGGGRGLLVSDPANLFFVLSLNSKEYPFEKVGHFNGKTSLPFINSGTRSLLGSFLYEHEKVLSGGLFGGSMSLRWAMLNLDKLKPTISSGGTKTIDGRKVYVLNYFPSGGGGGTELTMRLYFDAENFHHVRSEYRREIPAPKPTFGTQNQVASSTMQLTETFADFKTVEGFTLPHSYKVEFLSNSNSSMYQCSWALKNVQYVFNQKLQPDFFTFDSK